MAKINATTCAIRLLTRNDRKDAKASTRVLCPRPRQNIILIELDIKPEQTVLFESIRLKVVRSRTFFVGL